MTTGTIPDFAGFIGNLQDAASSRTQDAVELVRHVAPVGSGGDRPHGQYAAGIDGSFTPASDGGAITITGPAPLTGWLRGGTAAHEIVPRHNTASGRLGYLRFEVAGGQIVFTQHVNHPGSAPNRFEEQVADELEALASDVVADALNRTVGQA